MEKEMTIEEIASQFDSEWVLIEDPKTDEDLKVLGGKVSPRISDTEYPAIIEPAIPRSSYPA